MVIVYLLISHLIFNYLRQGDVIPSAICGPQYNDGVCVRGHGCVLGPTQTHFGPSRWARAGVGLRGAQGMFVPNGMDSVTITITLEGIEEIKTEKNDNKTLRRIFFSPAL